MQAAFGAYADTHKAASILRCWSNWNTLCDFLYTGDVIAANPMPHCSSAVTDDASPGAHFSTGCCVHSRRLG